MSKIFFYSAVLFFSFFLITPSLAADGSQAGRCSLDLDNKLCYTVQTGDNLWNIAKDFLGNGLRYGDIEEYVGKTDNISKKIKNQRVIHSGQVVIFPKNFKVKGFWNREAKVTPVEKNIYSIVQNYNKVEVMINGKIYDGPFSFARDLSISKDGRNITYIADPTPAFKECSQGEHGFHFVFNTFKNPHYSCGWDYKLLTFSPSGKYYAVRNNLGDGAGKEQFLVLSNLGNSQYYDYLDSIQWLDDETFVYRAQINDQWRVVVGSKEQKIYSYIDNLIINNGLITYRAKDDDGSWSYQTIKN